MIRRRIEAHKQQRQDNRPLYVSDLIFRGQGDQRWKLETTLERVDGSPLFSSYFAAMLGAKAAVETMIGKAWNLMSYADFDDWLSQWGPMSRLDLLPPPGYEFMVYLRHHGFPSPLMDWTRSPYAAAFFAYDSSPDDAEYVSIYGYASAIGEGNTFDGRPFIYTLLGQHMTTDVRHQLQQSLYTIAVNGQTEGIGAKYDSHDEVFRIRRPNQGQIWRVNIPANERPDVLQELERLYGITAYSLYNSEDALIRTLANRAFLFSHH